MSCLPVHFEDVRVQIQRVAQCDDCRLYLSVHKLLANTELFIKRIAEADFRFVGP